MSSDLFETSLSRRPFPYILQSSYLLPFLSLLMTLITFIPLFSNGEQPRDEIMNSTFVIHSSLGVVCCSIPLIIQDLFHRPITDYISYQIPQRLLLFSLFLPSLLVYTLNMTNNLSPSLFICVTKAQDILFFGGLLTFYSYYTTKHLDVVLSIGFYMLFSIGTVVSSFPYDQEAGSHVAFSFVVIGLIGFFGLSLRLLCLHKAVYSTVFKDHTIVIDKIFAMVLIANLVLRPVALYHAKFAPVLLVTNLITVLFLSTLHSAVLLNELARTKIRLEIKRFFIRYISHEMRTPLNCVQMGLELAISQAKLLDVSDIPKIHTGPRRDFSDSLGEFSKSCSRANDSLLDTLETAYSSCQTAIEILNDSLNYDKLEAEEMTLNISKVPLQTLIEKSLCPFLIQAHQYNVSLDYHIPESLRYLSVTVDFNRFSQVIRNLISNSLKFTPSGGKITVSVSEQKNMDSTIFFDSDSSLTDELSSISRNSSRHPHGGDYLRIDISDTGAGMSKDQQESLFKGAVQFVDPSALNTNGAGLGLWISKSIVDLHGGSITVHSEGVPGKGCIFSILIKKDTFQTHCSEFSQPPSAISASEYHIDDIEANNLNDEQLDSSEPTGSSFNWNSKPNRIQPLASPKSFPSTYEDLNSLSRVILSGEFESVPLPFRRVALCVDDSAMSRKIMGKYLESHFEVIYATDGLSALDVIKNSLNGERDIDVVFMDNQMPVMDGLEATFKIRELGYEKPIIGITGDCEPDQIREFLAHGATRILQKPLQLNVFGELILDVMGENAPESLVVSSS